MLWGLVKKNEDHLPFLNYNENNCGFLQDYNIHHQGFVSRLFPTCIHWSYCN
jgi:hypothetical protein